MLFRSQLVIFPRVQIRFFNYENVCVCENVRRKGTVLKVAGYRLVEINVKNLCDYRILH